MNDKKSLGSYAVLIAAACALPAALAVGEMYVQGVLDGHSPGWKELFWQGNEWLVLGALTPVTFFLGRRFPLRGPHLGRTLLVHVCGALIMCVGWAGTGAVLRVALGIGPPNETSLSEEVGFLKQCLAIEQIRFSDRLNVTYAIDEECLGGAVPTFILQPLVENALRHGIAARADAGEITIGAHRENGSLLLYVRDDGIGVDASANEGVGLGNTRERLSTLYGSEASLELMTPPEGGTIATIRLPYRHA